MGKEEVGRRFYKIARGRGGDSPVDRKTLLQGTVDRILITMTGISN